ncbi:MAG: hypothetical protein HYW65_02955 [Candidatus Liptonbacteria bacterium]|nr:hypothetical protein [Candidatus Liptonbacteria bacterium]
MLGDDERQAVTTVVFSSDDAQYRLIKVLLVGLRLQPNQLQQVENLLSSVAPHAVKKAKEEIQQGHKLTPPALLDEDDAALETDD